MTRLRLGTRRSALATTQSGWVADQLRALGHEVELVEITTFGDTSTQPLSAIGGTGVFAAAIRQALLAGEVDLAVHSLKDLPVAPEPGLTVAAVTRREDPRDEVTELIDPLQMLPAPGQGALAVEVRSDDPAATAAVRPLDDADTRASV